MTVKYLVLGASGKVAEVADGTGEVPALVVATRPLKTFENKSVFFSNADYGIDMNQDASAGGTPENVHDGTDNVYWTASDIIGGGKTTFNSTNQNHTSGGTKSVKVDNSPVGDVFQFAKGSDLDASGYVSLTLWIYVDKDWKVRDDIELYGWDTGTGLEVGTAVSLQDYFNWADFDVWQKITIPLTDMGALASYPTLDALRVRIVSKEGKSPKFYLDDIAFEETGTPIEYTIEASVSTWFHVESLTLSFADAYAGTVANGTMAGLPYDKLLGETLTAGIDYKRTELGKTIFSTTILTLMDLMQFPRVEITGSGSDGTNTWMTVNIPFDKPLTLHYDDADKLSFTISEDLTGLLHFRATAMGYEEQR